MVHAGSYSDPAYGRRTVTLRAGQDLDSVNFRLRPKQSVSGKVVDHNDEPLTGVEVVLLGREYFLGELRYFRRAAARTDDRGEYRIVHQVAPGTGWLLWARQVHREMDPISDAPEDPKLRRPAVISTYYPSAASPEGGTLLMLKAGEQRERVDIRMLRSPNCAWKHSSTSKVSPGS